MGTFHSFGKPACWVRLPRNSSVRGARPEGPGTSLRASGSSGGEVPGPSLHSNHAHPRDPAPRRSPRPPRGRLAPCGLPRGVGPHHASCTGQGRCGERRHDARAHPRSHWYREGQRGECSAGCDGGAAEARGRARPSTRCGGPVSAGVRLPQGTRRRSGVGQPGDPRGRASGPHRSRLAPARRRGRPGRARDLVRGLVPRTGRQGAGPHPGPASQALRRHGAHHQLRPAGRDRGASCPWSRRRPPSWATARCPPWTR